MFEVKMAGYCPRLFLLLFMDLKNAKKNEKRPKKELFLAAPTQ